MSSETSKFGVSQPVRRVEDERLLRGRGRYVDDLGWRGAAHVHFLRSDVAHGRIRRIDAEAARAAPGVVAVILGQELTDAGVNDIGSGRIDTRDGGKSARPRRPLLADEAVRYGGEAMAMIIADTPAAARDAAELIEIDLEILPAVAEMSDARADGAPQLHEDAPGNVCFDWALGDEAAVDARLAEAAHVVTLPLVNNRIVANSIEPRGAAAMWDASRGKLLIESNTQGVWGLKSAVSEMLGLEPDAVRVVTEDVGGGFGMKAFNYPEQLLAAYAAKTTGRAVRWMATRSEGFLTDAMGRDHKTVAQAGFDAEHRLIALKVETEAGLGAYLSPYAPFIPTTAASRVLPGVYDVQDVFYGVTGVMTNTTPVDAYRGAGRPESIYMLERLMDASARALGVDPIALRRKNYIPLDKLPYLTAVGETYDTGDFNRVTSAGLEKADVAGFGARKAASAAGGKLRGLGYCYYIEAILGSASETATLEINEGAAGETVAELYVGTQSNGQGHETAYAQILSQRSGIPFERIRIVQGDSDRIAEGGGTGGSRSVTVQGVAINAASDTLVEKLRPVAEEMLEVGPADLVFEDGAYHVAGTDRALGVLEVAGKALSDGRGALAQAQERTTLPGRSYPNGFHIAEVEIDPETGVTEVARYTMVDDFGVLINPILAEGQAQGGVIQGVGQALTERVVYDAEAQLLTASFMDYGMPRAEDAPVMAFHSEPTPSTANPLGMKGCGEAGTVGALAAVTNAALDALAPRGVTQIDMPLTPLRVWTYLQSAAPGEAAE